MAAAVELQPVFIVGAHRSGTTLLRFMLASNPRLYIPPESDFIPRFFARRPLAELSERRMDRILHTIFTRYRFAKEWIGPPPTARELSCDMDNATPAAFLDALYRRYAAQHGAARWGDKTPIYSSYIPLLATLFPAARIVHLIRDGRDVALSTVETWARRRPHIDLYSASRLWVARCSRARAAGRELGPARYHELRYEQLVTSPERELRELAEFIGEDFSPHMLEHHRLASRRLAGDRFHAPVRNPVSDARVARWRRQMSASDLRLVEHVAGGLLEELGYGTSDAGELVPADRVRLTALAAKYAALYGARRMLQSVRLVSPI